MNIKDGRTLTKETLEHKRLIAIDAIKKGKTQTEVAELLHVARETVSIWWNKYKRAGLKALKNKKKGTHQRKELKPWQSAVLAHLLTTRTPRELGLPYPLWNREAVAELIITKFGISRSVSTIGRYLKAWDFSLQVAAKRAYEQDPDVVKHWIKEVYPQIKEEAAKDGAIIYWLDEMGIASSDSGGRSYGKKGHTPVVKTPGRRYKCNVLSTIETGGELHFKLEEREVNKDVFIDFLEELLSWEKRKIYLILDNHPAHIAKKVRAWVEEHNDQLRLFFLPAYSPELNPVELLNHDTKANAVKKKMHRWLKDLVENVYQYLINRPAQVIKNYFFHPLVKYSVS